MVNDILVAGMIAGIIAIVFGTILDYGLYLIGLIDNHISMYVSAILQPKEVLVNKESILVGLIGHLIMGAIFGICISLTLYYTKYTYSGFKGIMIGLVFWLILHQALTAKFWVPLEFNLSSKGVLYQFFIHLIEGLITVILLNIFRGIY